MHEHVTAADAELSVEVSTDASALSEEEVPKVSAEVVVSEEVPEVSSHEGDDVEESEMTKLGT